MHRRIVVLGSGPAGVAAARTAARMGAHAVLIDSGRLGGVSTNSGVLPARVLAHAARLKRESGHSASTAYGRPRPSWIGPPALQRLSNVVEALHVRKEIAEEARKLAQRFLNGDMRVSRRATKATAMHCLPIIRRKSVQFSVALSRSYAEDLASIRSPCSHDDRRLARNDTDAVQDKIVARYRLALRPRSKCSLL
jgi:FAD dependent oxidoreductase